RPGICQKAFDAVDVDGIVIAHHDNRRGIVLTAEFFRHFERAGQCLAALERAQTGSLDSGSIGHRIGERHAELDNVGSGLGQRLHDRQRCLEIGIATHEIGDQCRAIFLPQAGEKRVDAGGVHTGYPCVTLRHGQISMPIIVATVWTSLSPRPERLTIMIWSLPMVGAIFTAWAMAWADSRAGMMPSTLVMSLKASSASSSRIGTYLTRPVSRSQECSGPTPG